MKDLASAFRRKRATRDDSTSTTSSATEPEGAVRELLDVEAFREALVGGTQILIVDYPNATQVLHPYPQACSGVDMEWFIQKVIDNRGKNGAYFAIVDEDAARNRWPHRWPQMTACQRCS